MEKFSYLSLLLSVSESHTSTEPVLERILQEYVGE